jgi:hypothetical protein
MMLKKANYISNDFFGLNTNKKNKQSEREKELKNH